MNNIYIDVREPSEYNSGHVKGAVNIPPTKLMSGIGLENIPKNAPIVLYCRSGSRANMSSFILREKGYTNITNGTNQQQIEAKYNL